MITMTNLSKAYGGQVLFESVNLQLDSGKRYGIVGANGSGKSTLLRILSGDEEASTGDVSVPKRARLGVLKQDHFAYENVPILDVVMMGNEELWRAIEEKEEVLAAAETHFDAERYAELEDTVLRFDGYSLEARAGEILEGLNIPSKVHKEPLSVLSGGFKLRVLLAQVLASLPDVLLLDEPTNHLDILSIRWLETFLEEFEGCVVVVSHDHRFLDNVCTHIIDVDYERALLYTGDYSAFVAAKAGHRERKEAEIAKQQKEIAHKKAFVERFKAKATKARQAQSRVKQMEKIVIEKLPQTSRREPSFSFSANRPSGKVALEVEGISKAYEGNQVLEDVSLTVQRNDRVAIIGPNGIGKSTLLKIAMGEVTPDAGQTEWGHEVHTGYFAQDHHELEGADRTELHEWLWTFCPGATVGFVRGHLARVLFTQEEAHKRIGNLSGGEAARLIFARLAVTHPNTLILDEPTNHLDLEGIAGLAKSLCAYEGTVIFVSHDRWFVGEVATRIIEITPEGIRDFSGGYEEYLIHCGDDHLDADAGARKGKKKRA